MGNMNSIEGVLLTPLKRIENPLGNVLHGMKGSDPGYAGFAEAYFTTIHPGMIKPWKQHTRMTLNLIVPVGCVRFIVYDDRDGSSTKDTFLDVTISKENYQRVTIPPGLWLSMKGEGSALSYILNLANLEHDPGEMKRLKQEDIVYKF